MKKMGIKIDLSSFFDDERKMVYIMVDPNWKSISCLQKRIKYLFGVTSVRILNSDGCFLPPQETIEIVQFCEGLKAFVPKESLEGCKKKKEKKSKCMQRSPQESDSEEGFSNIKRDDKEQKKRKYYSMDSAHAAGSASNHAKRRKNSKANVNEILTSIRYENKCREITSTSEQLQSPQISAETKSKKAKSKQSKHSKMMDVGYDNQCQSNVIVEQNATSSEKNRISFNELINNQLQKYQTSTPKEVLECTNAKEKMFNNSLLSVVRTSNISSSAFLNESQMMVKKMSKDTINTLPNLNNPFRNQLLLSKGHIFFNDTGEVVSTTNKSKYVTASKSDKESKTTVIFRCHLEKITNNEKEPKPRIFYIKRENFVNKATKQVVEIRENIVLEPIQSLDIKNINNSLVIEENAANKFQNSKKSTELASADTQEEAVISKEENDSNDTTSNTEGITNENAAYTSDNKLKNSQIKNKNTEKSINEQASISELPSTSKNELSVMSVDCVDLSIDDSDKNVNDSDIEEISEIIDLNETEDNCNSTHSVSGSSLDNISIKKILPFCTNMTNIPNTNDIIVFKMGYTDKKQQMAKTNFLAGKVEYINKRTKSIKILILDGFTEVCHIDLKFILNLNESYDSMKYIQIKMSDMIEPKRYSMCK